MITTLTYTDNSISTNVIFDESVFINATSIAKPFGKQASKWLENSSTIEYITALCKSKNLQTADLVTVKQGGNDKTSQGTWLHPKLAVAFARWLDPTFAVWCDSKIEELLSTGGISVTTDERIVWLDKFDFFYKTLNQNKHWGPKFASIIKELEENEVSIRSQQKFVIQASKRVTTEGRIPMYKRMLEYYNKLMEDGAIERRTWEDMTSFIYKRVIQVQSSRVTKLKNNTEEDALIEKITKERDEYLTKMSLYKDKYEELTNPSTITPLPHPLLDSEDSINEFIYAIKLRNDLTLQSFGYLQANSNAGKVSSKQKSYPDMSLDAPIGYKSAALWMNDSTFLQIQSTFGDIKHGVALKQLDNDIMFGCKVLTLGNKIYFYLNENSGYIVVYQHIIKSI